MKTKKLLLIMFALTLIGPYSNADGLSINVIKGTVDMVNVGQKLVVVNGLSYKYVLDEEQSLYSYSEYEKPAIPLRELKAGKVYYFELISNKEDAKYADYKIVRYISNQPLEDAEEFDRDEK
ncbi:hypothetical protein [Marinicella rhabdoformis]|uniref:hypothetical protein n=1 Tax=Marinicella rhabdoformis TaxID=2580566 RepID=UPI0012AED2D4|nr:hypothetical protein [Marinicella rhabdoformis]